MAEWLVEEGIGEHRAVQMRGEEVVAAQLDWLETLSPGLIAHAVLISRAKGSRRGTVRFPSGEEALIDGLLADASEGAALCVEVVRSAITERGRGKLAQVRPSSADPRPAPSLAERLSGEGHTVKVVRRFPGHGWQDLISEAQTGELAFAGGTVLLYPAPAMTLIDIDGTLSPPALALAAVPAIAAAIRQMDLNGAIGIDFPTLTEKAQRRAVDEALKEALGDWRHESTAMNGFGFVQLVARRTGPSILHRAQHDPLGLAARLLLRQAERIDDPGVLLLTASEAVRSAVLPEWEAELVRRSGRIIRWHINPGLAPEGSFAQAVPR